MAFRVYFVKTRELPIVFTSFRQVAESMKVEDDRDRKCEAKVRFLLAGDRR